MPRRHARHLLKCAWSWKTVIPLLTGRWGQRRRGTSGRQECSQGCPLLLLPFLPPSSPHLLPLPLCQMKFLSVPGWAGTGNQAAGLPGGGRRWRRRSPWHCQHFPLDLTGGGRRRRKKGGVELKERGGRGGKRNNKKLSKSE